MDLRKRVPGAEDPGTGHMIRLTTSGSDRATAYGMSTKCVALDECHVLCTWLDVSRQNHYAVVDTGRREIAYRGTLGPPRRDNHCGAALCVTPDGMTECMIGAHHGSFMHCRMSAHGDRGSWKLVQEAVGEGATYPSLVCDSAGTLHLTYRRNRPLPYHVMYCRRRRGDQAWSAPRPLVRAAVPVHTWTTHALESGPDGHLHLVLGNTRKLPGGAWYYGASHLYSDDSGGSWRQLGVPGPLTLPADAAALRRIESDGFPPERTQSAEEKQRLPVSGPSQYYYLKFVLSNPMVDGTGCPYVLVHNLLRGDAELFRVQDSAWVGTPLGNVIGESFPNHHISHMGQLSRHHDGTMEVVLTIVPEGVASHRYGPRGTKLARLLLDAAGFPRGCALVCEPHPEGIPDWQPNSERPAWHTRVPRPRLLWTRGLNSHTLTETHTNINDVETEVWLDPRATS